MCEKLEKEKRFKVCESSDGQQWVVDDYWKVGDTRKK